MKVLAYFMVSACDMLEKCTYDWRWMRSIKEDYNFEAVCVIFATVN